MINLTITKLTSKIKNPPKRSSGQLNQVLYLFRRLTHFTTKTNFKFSNFSLSLCRTKDKVKRKERGMMRITV